MQRLRLRLGKILHKRGMPATELARRAGISANTARSLAWRGGGRRFDLDIIEAIAHALEMSPVELFEIYEDEEGGSEEADMERPAIAVA
jgi:DNA-binding Xre family transcriptional regulator